MSSSGLLLADDEHSVVVENVVIPDPDFFLILMI